MSFTDDQKAALKAPLAREHVKSRQQAGRQLSYVEGWLVVSEANRIFGFDGWDRETIECRCVAERETMMGQNHDRPGWRVAYVGKVRITVRAGEHLIVREGTGYGSGIDADLGEAHESAAKEAETDATKRSLMTFGNPFGLALYDKAQAEVAPVALRRPASAAETHSPASSPPPAGNGKAPPAPPAARPAKPLPPDIAQLSLARDRIFDAIAGCKLPREVDAILDANQADLRAIKLRGSETYNRLLQHATAKTQELLSNG